jgi:cardiolipin synthase A/B
MTALLALHIIYWISLGLVVVVALLILFEPPLRYVIRNAPALPDSEEFLRVVCALADAQIHRGSVEMLSDGKVFYPAELDAIEKAVRSIHIEAFIFHPGAIGDRFLNALVNRARQGVQVKIVIDAVGSFPTPDRYFQPLRDVGGQVRRYQPLGLATLKTLNNRTHRELIVIDGAIGFIGGAGIAPHWDVGDKGKPPWRDMMFRVKGGLVAGLQSTFAENWLESSGEVLTDPADFPAEIKTDGGTTTGMVVISSPTAGRSTRNRVLYQVLLASARRTIHIHSPYFLPDRSATAELVRAVRDRNVKVRIIVPSEFNNHPFARLASRRRYGPLLQAGVEIHEYKPGMIHTKTLTVDGLWVVIGSTNFDSRSFDLNDEVNLVAVDAELACRVEEEFVADLAQCQQMTFEQWSHRSLSERMIATVGRVLERQE